ncbi:MAG: family 16 glycosylhydrolase [Saprospiraceae bacterium]
MLFSFISISFGQVNWNNIQQDTKKKFFTSWQKYTYFPYSNLECSGEPWKLVFSDEFDGTTINTNTWYTFSPDGGNCTAGLDDCFWARGRDGDNGGNFKGLFRDQNIDVNNGSLKLHVKKESNTWYGVDFDYSASMIWSKANSQFKYGKFEARIKMHAGGGFFPAFWLFSVSGKEIDIIEYKGGKKLTEFPTTIHRWSPSHLQDVYSVKSIGTNTIDFSKGFHTYSVTWDPHIIIWYVDNIEVRRFYRYQTKRWDGVIIPFDCSNYKSNPKLRESLFMDDARTSIILNTSIIEDDDRLGAIDDNDFPSYMEVDYVRVYQRFPQTGKVDLCSGEISGSDEICFNGEQTYNFNTFDGESSTVTWTTSSNLNIVSTSNNIITVNPTSSTFTSGWIEANVNFTHAPCSTKTFKKFLYGGGLIEGTYISGSYNSQPLHTVNFSNSNSFTINLDNPLNTYIWQLTSGSANIGGTNWNPQTLQIASGSSSASVNISTNTDCGLISRTVAFVHTGGWYRVSPNPSSNFIYIKAEEDYEVEYSDKNGELTTQLIQPSFSKVTLYNLNSGEPIFEQNAYQPVKNMTLDIAHLSTGQYVLHIKNEHNISTHQIMIER